MTKKNIFYLIISSSMLCILIYRVYENYINENLLKHSKTTYGFIYNIKKGAVRNPANASFYYFVQKKKFTFYEQGNYLKMNLGDTVLIKYATKDHNVATVVDKYYMKKYKYLK